MTKLVVLKLDGDLEQGIRVTLEIGKLGSRPETETTGSLPAAASLLKAIDRWRSTYRCLGNSARIKAISLNYDGDITQSREQCLDCATLLHSCLNGWLRSESFRPIRETWLRELKRDYEIRVLIRTSSQPLRQLPWQLWDLVEDYPLAEVALSTPESQQPTALRRPTYRDRVRILAILGNSIGIDVHKDRQLLESLPDAETTFLVEPQRQDINEQLWEQPWDILFFAGHSKTIGDTGHIYINQTDSLTLGDLEYALKTVVRNGLQLAIFNSCDGLGLARTLQQLQIPELIVMREPVPDQVAQEFLTGFLAAFASGQELYLAERTARERLQGLEDRFPCASWLPVMFQHPAATPPKWLDLGRRPTTICPYQGLSAFRESDAQFFKGRETFTQILRETVQNQSLVAVIGPSGSGKSSVVFAGLIPYLHQQENWRIFSFRPGNRPLHSLATALISQNGPQMSLTDRVREIRNLVVDLRQQENALRDVVEAMLCQDLGMRLLMVVDQFEELYTLLREPQERLVFLDRLLEAINHSPNFTLVLTLRADFLAQALSYRPFADALQYADLKLGPMNREELQQAVEQPASILGVSIEQGLTERMLEAVSAEPGDLPLLEFALKQLWDNQRDAQLTHAAYEQIGGVEAALTRYAEQVYGRLNYEERERAQRIFIQLVRPGEGTEDTRRLATRTEVGAENWDLVTRLANDRLVVSSSDEVTGQETVEIVHEVLIRGWDRLRLWIDLDRAFRTWQERLRTAMRQWEASDNDDGALLRGMLLAEAEGWLQQRLDEISSSERVFIQMSLELCDRQAQEQEEQRQRELQQERKARKAAQTRNRVVTISTVVLSGLAIFAFYQRNEAQKGSLRSIFALVQTSEASLLANRQLESLETAVQAGKRLKDANLEQEHLSQSVSLVLQRAIYTMQERNRLEGHTSSVDSVSFSPDGKTLASGSGDKTIKLWNVVTGQLINTLNGHSRDITSVSFSPDGKTLASGSLDNTIKLWNVTTGQLISTLNGHTSGVASVSFSPDGKTLASGNGDKTIKLWDVVTGQLVNTLNGHSNFVASVSFSPDGKTLASGSADNTIKLWDVATGKAFNTLNGRSPVNSVSFSPDGKTLASGSNNTIKVWNVATGQLINTLYGDSTGANSVSFSSDGKTLASADSYDNTIKLWDLTTGKPIDTLDGHSHAVMSISFSPDGKTLASGSSDNTIKLWNVTVGQPIDTLDGHTLPVRSVSFSPDGRTLASGSSDNTIKLWNVVTGQLINTLNGHSRDINSVSFSPDGRTLASGSSDDTIKLWDVATGQLINTLDGHSRGVNSVSFSPDGRTLASGGFDNTIKLWDLTTGQLINTLKRHSNFVTSVSFSPDGKTLASGSWDQSIKLWDVATGQLTNTLKGHSSPVTSVSFSPDGKTLASGSGDTTIKLWNVATGKSIITFYGYNHPVYSVSFSPGGKTLASGSADSSSLDGKTLVGRGNNSIELWKVYPGELDELMTSSCDWLRGYLQTNPNVSETDRHICDGIGTPQ